MGFVLAGGVAEAWCSSRGRGKSGEAAKAEGSAAAAVEQEEGKQVLPLFCRLPRGTPAYRTVLA
jgi:hypothetical protein